MTESAENTIKSLKYQLEVNGNRRSRFAQRLLEKHGITHSTLYRPRDHDSEEPGNYPILTITGEGISTVLTSIYAISDLFPPTKQD